MIKMNSSNLTSISQTIVQMNTFFPSIDGCLRNNNKHYCNYSSFLVVCGYICHLCVFPAIILRMSQLAKIFRNQYNISFLWLCSILLISCIDLLEFIIEGNNQIYSILIVTLICVYFVMGLTAMFKYMRNYSINGASYQNGLTMVFSICIFSLILFARIWTKNTLSKYPNINKNSPTTFYLSNTYFFLYYFVYCLFGTVQVRISFYSLVVLRSKKIDYLTYVLINLKLNFFKSRFTKI